MRSASVTFENEFDLAPQVPKRRPVRSPRRNVAVAKGKSRKKAQPFGSRLAAFSRYATIAMSATFVVGIIANALVAQKGQHPAPLFGRAIVLGNAKPVVPPRIASQPTQLDKVDATRSDRVPASRPNALPSAGQQAHSPISSAHPEAKGRMDDDPIARLLASGAAPVVQPRKIKHRMIAAAQKTLVH